MKKFTASLITSQIPSRKLRKKLRERLISGKLRVAPGNVVELAVRSVNNIGIYGRGNRLVVKTKEIPLRLDVSIVGNGTKSSSRKVFARNLCAESSSEQTPTPATTRKSISGETRT